MPPGSLGEVRVNVAPDRGLPVSSTLVQVSWPGWAVLFTVQFIHSPVARVRVRVSALKVDAGLVRSDLGWGAQVKVGLYPAALGDVEVSDRTAAPWGRREVKPPGPVAGLPVVGVAVRVQSAGVSPRSPAAVLSTVLVMVRLGSWTWTG